MLRLTVHHDDQETELEFEHSLFTISKWEALFKRPFFGKTSPDASEKMEYFECMVMTPGVDPRLVYALSPAQLEELSDYITTEQTGSSVPDTSNGSESGEILSSELIYHYMIEMHIDWSAEHWHFSRLLMLIRVIAYKKRPVNIKDSRALEAKWADANERQKALFKTKG